jgi:DnaJ family protein C protein 16
MNPVYRNSVFFSDCIDAPSSLQAPATDKYSNVLFQGNLLDGLPNWLDRLFEGTTHRYYISYWPDFAPK